MLHCLSGEHLHTSFGIHFSIMLTILHACYHTKGRFHGYQPESHALSPVPLSASKMQDKSSEETVL